MGVLTACPASVGASFLDSGAILNNLTSDQRINIVLLGPVTLSSQGQDVLSLSCQMY